MNEAVRQIAEALAEETDLRPDGVDMVVKRPAPDGCDEINIVLHEDGDRDDQIVLGFDSETYEKIVEQLLSQHHDEWVRKDAEAGGGGK